MCGRYTLKSRAEIIAETFGVPVPPTLPERFNITPSQQVLAVREKPDSHQRELVALHWGLIPFWADDSEIRRRTINARSESAATKPAFQSSVRACRCLIVADGFYEWQALNGKKQPYTSGSSPGSRSASAGSGIAGTSRANQSSPARS